MTFMETLRKDKKFLFVVVGIILLTLVIPYIILPALFLWWFYKRSSFSRKTKTVLTVVIIGLFIVLLTAGVVAYTNDQEPTLTVTEPESSAVTTSDNILIKGRYSPEDRDVWINGKKIQANNGSFETQYELQKGENTINVEAGNWKRAKVSLLVVRELTDEEKASRITPTKVVEKKVYPTQAPQTPEQRIEAKIRSTLRARTNTDKDTFKEIRVNKSFGDEEGYVVTVLFNGNDNLSEDLIKKGIWKDMGEIYTALYKEPMDVVEATLLAHFPMQDRYGNSSDQMVLKTALSKAEAQKVNWSQDQATLNLQILPGVWETQKDLFK